jgi:hypothetical protein
MKIISCNGPSLDKANKQIPYYVQYDPDDTGNEYGIVTIKQTATLFENEGDIEKALMRLRYKFPHVKNWKITDVWFRVTARGKYD